MITTHPAQANDHGTCITLSNPAIYGLPEEFKGLTVPLMTGADDPRITDPNEKLQMALTARFHAFWPDELIGSRLHGISFESVSTWNGSLRFDIVQDPHFWGLFAEQVRRYFPATGTVALPLEEISSPFLEWVLEADGQNYMLTTKQKVDEYFATATDIPVSLTVIPEMVGEVA